LSNEYAEFKKDPAVFLQSIAGNIAFKAQQELFVDQLRMQIVRFLELALSKLVWSPEENLDDIYWSLVHRYSYFLRVCTDIIPDTFYRDVRADINTNKLVLFDLDQANGGIIESKFAHLNRVLFESEHARNKAITQGVLVS
jgi:hypothetical protein